MPSIKLQSGQTAHYSYDPRLDELTVRLNDAPAKVAETVHPGIRRAHVRRDAETGALVGLRVSGVQELILEAVIRDLVAQLDREAEDHGAGPDAPDAPDDEPDADDPDSAPHAPAPDRDEPEADDHGPAPGAPDDDESQADDYDPAPHAPAPDRDEPEVYDHAAAPDAPDRDEPDADDPDSAPHAPAPDRDEPEADDHAAAPDTPSAPDRDEPEADDHGPAPSAPDRDEPEVYDRDAAPDAPSAPDAPGAPDAPDAPAPDRDEPVESPDLGPTTRPDIAGDSELESFASMGLRPSLSQAIGDMGFTEPTPIQRRAMPEALSGRDMVGLAQTGTGKTLAFVVAGLQRLLDSDDRRHRPRMLVVTPVRELAVQVAEHAEQLARHTDLRVASVYGGANMRAQTSALKRGVDVVVATPGRLLDHLRRRNVDLSSVEVLVLDEADRMLDMGFLPDVREILHNLPTERQTLLFGATMPPAIESLSLQFQHDPVLVEVARRLPPESIKQQLYPVGRHLKVPLLVHLLTHDREQQRVLVFTERRTEADLVTRRLRDAGLQVAAMHGDIRQRERELSLERLRDGRVQVLVATNVAARGLDIEGISHVVNYDIPQTVDEYVHRIGRTARADATGTAYTFVAPGDQWMVKRIEAALERELPRVEAEGFDYDVPTPSWAQPSPDDIARSLEKPKSAADISRRLRPR